VAVYPGSFSDGRSAARRDVTVELDVSGLRIRDAEGRELERWPYDELLLVDEDRAGQPLRLKCGVAGVARLIVPDRRLLDDLSHDARALIESKSNPIQVRLREAG